ncbi:mutS protein-like protein 5-like [Hibiscus syriacus]|uniref:MutS protein-like protein 5-like n=1 Tax=Hibiscus syriacus TaxID=106335 RepID=A0A6A2Y4Y3_HIBSY|nr:GDSL esterase/lipase At5g55050-like [Hibiscus syriacus]KAE8679140.1 mutS protein-like protein 5-like [Hibiscus syriacus]
MEGRRVLVTKKNIIFFFVISLLGWNPELSEAQMAPALFIFGDSQVDVGNNNHLLLSIAKADFPHNGIDFARQQPTGRFSNGKNAADFLAKKIGLSSSPAYLSLSDETHASYMNGVNFASGGSGILNSTGYYGKSIRLTEQIHNFFKVHQVMVQKMGSNGVEKHFSKSLFVIVTGSNDILDCFESESKDETGKPRELVDLMINYMKSHVKKLYEFGARKVLVAGVGAVGCVPRLRLRSKTHECDEEVNSWAAKYNEQLKATLVELKSELQDLNYSFFDLHAIMQNIIRNPTAHGFKEVKAACCGIGVLRAKIPCLPISLYCPNRKNHVFWDLYHPTEAMARIVADAIFDGPSEYSVPMNVRQLVLA